MKIIITNFFRFFKWFIYLIKAKDENWTIRHLSSKMAAIGLKIWQ